VRQLLINTAILLLAGFGSLIVGALVLNNVPLYEPPGFAVRLKTYLTTHSAETRRHHPFPELELPCYRLAPRALFTRIEQAVSVLGWEIIDSDPERYRLHAVVTTRLLKFKDDVEIQLQLADSGTELHVRASSRIGRGDLGANTRHILDLLNALTWQA
jgi:uncharacterized protein (DUF1499 family)